MISLQNWNLLDVLKEGKLSENGCLRKAKREPLQELQDGTKEFKIGIQALQALPTSIAESCGGRKIKENSFKLSKSTIKKRKRQWQSFTSKYSIYEEETCEAAFEIDISELSAAFGEPMLCHETKETDSTAILQPNVKKRKLTVYDRMPLDTCLANEDRVPQFLVPDLLLSDSVVDQEDCRSEIVSGSLMSQLRRHSSSLKQHGNGSHQGNVCNYQRSCPAESFNQFSSSYMSLSKSAKVNTAGKSHSTNVSGKNVGSNLENMEEMKASNENQKESLIDMVIATKEDSYEKKQYSCLSKTSSSSGVDVTSDSLGKHKTKNIFLHKESASSVASLTTSSVKANQQFPSWKATRRSVSNAENELNALTTAFESMPLSFWKTYRTNLRLWTPVVLLQKCNLEIPCASKVDAQVILENNTMSKNVKESNNVSVTNLPHLDSGYSTVLCSQTELVCNQEPHHKLVSGSKCQKNFVDDSEDSVMKNYKTSNEVLLCLEKEENLCHKDSIVRVMCSTTEGRKTRTVEHRQLNQSSRAESQRDVTNDNSRDLKRQLECLLNNNPEGVKDEIHSEKNNKSYLMESFYEPGSIPTYRRHIGDVSLANQQATNRNSACGVLVKNVPPDVSAKSVLDNIIHKTSLQVERKNDSKNNNSEVVQCGVSKVHFGVIGSDKIVNGCDTNSLLPPSSSSVITNVKNRRPETSVAQSVAQKCICYMDNTKSAIKNSAKSSNIFNGISHEAITNKSFKEVKNYTCALSEKSMFNIQGTLLDHKIKNLFYEIGGTASKSNVKQNACSNVIPTRETVSNSCGRPKKEFIQDRLYRNIMTIPSLEERLKFFTNVNYSKHGHRKDFRTTSSGFEFHTKMRYESNYDLYKNQNQKKTKRNKRFCMKVVTSDADKRAFMLDFSETKENTADCVQVTMENNVVC